jgi:hypothetical protein
MSRGGALRLTFSSTGREKLLANETGQLLASVRQQRTDPGERLSDPRNPLLSTGTEEGSRSKKL